MELKWPGGSLLGSLKPAPLFFQGPSFFLPSQGDHIAGRLASFGGANSYVNRKISMICMCVVARMDILRSSVAEMRTLIWVKGFELAMGRFDCAHVELLGAQWYPTAGSLLCFMCFWCDYLFLFFFFFDKRSKSFRIPAYLIVPSTTKPPSALYKTSVAQPFFCALNHFLHTVVHQHELIRYFFLR